MHHPRSLRPEKASPMKRALSPEYREIFSKFVTHYEAEAAALADAALLKELAIMRCLIDLTETPQPPLRADNYPPNQPFDM